MAKVIELTRGFVTIVDDADYEHLKQYNWCALVQKNGVYAVRNDGNGGHISIHRDLANPTGDLVADHKNGQTLDNRRENLRACTRKNNNRNMRKRHNASSQFKGVSFWITRQVWASYINNDGKRKHIGYFKTEAEAALAYNEAARELFGEFARLNELPE